MTASRDFPGPLRRSAPLVSTAMLLPALLTLAWTSRVSAQEGARVEIPDSVTEARVLAGSALFNGGSCTLCHAPAGLGTGHRAPDLSDAEWLHGEGTWEDIFHVIVWGVQKDEMKATTPRPFEMFPKGGMNYSSEELKAVTAYVWSLSRPRTSELVAQQQLFLEAARYRPAAEAEAIFRQAAERWPDRPLLAEQAMNRAGYDLLPDHPEAAVMVFRLNVEEHPESWNVHDSLAEGYEALGDTARAIAGYRRSLDMNPDNEHAVERLRALGVGGE